MQKLKVLQYNQSFMTYFGIYSTNLTKPTNEFFKSSIVYILFGMVGLCISLSALGIYENSLKLTLALDALLTLFSGIQCGGMFINLGLGMEKIRIFHLKLQEIVDHGD